MNKALIIDRYKNPKYFSKEISGKVGESINSSCGDEIYVGMDIENGTIKSCKYNGYGCSICLGTMDILVDNIVGKRVVDINNLDINYPLTLIGMSTDSNRIRCATLSLEAVKSACIGVE